VAYYDKCKQTQIGKVIAMLKDAGAAPDSAPRRQALVQNGLLSMVRCAVGLLCNPLKRSWSFSARELSFFAATLERLLRILHSAELPEKGELIELRLDCFHCHYIVEHKLIGIQEIRKADSIEHFEQSQYVNHVTFQEMGIQSL
jgi:hypothetical protein